MVNIDYSTGKHRKTGRPRWGDDQPHIWHNAGGKQWEAWATDTEDGWRKWHVADGGYCVATVKIKTTTERREDMTGYRAYRMARSTRYVITCRYYGGEASTEEYNGFKGEIATLRDVINWIAEDATLHTYIKFEIERQLRALGVEERTIWNCFNSDRKRENENLIRLLKTQGASQ
jgi:hypothetical protein